VPLDAATILHVEDDDAHAELVRRELGKAAPRSPVSRVADGAEAIAYLSGEGPYADRRAHPLPALVLLDLRLPKIDGLEVLRFIKEREALRPIPVVMLTSSDSERDLARAYDTHVNSYVVKPLDHLRFRALLADVARYWMELNANPDRSPA